MAKRTDNHRRFAKARKRWTERDVQRLRTLVGLGCDAREVARRLHRTVRAVALKMAHLDVTPGRPPDSPRRATQRQPKRRKVRR